MISINKWMMGINIVLCLIVFIPIAQGEQTYDITDCWSGIFTMNSESRDLTIMSFEFTGITRSNLENKIFDNCTVFYVGIARITPDKTTADGYTKYMDPDGDFVVMESVREGEVTTMTFLQGTGKWKGIKGGGKIRRITTGKPIVSGTLQGCSKHIGTFELPK
jgi:hypothetical protein